MTPDKAKARRRHGDEFKARVLAQCDKPGQTLMGVARLYGLSASVVHGWRKLAREGHVDTGAAPRGFIAVPIASPPAPSQPCVEVQLGRGELMIKLIWPVAAAGELATWARQLLREPNA